MHQLAAHTVRQALSGGARIDPLEDYDALAALDAAARATDTLPVWREIDLLDRPVIVGDPDSRWGHPAILYPPSYAALEWIDQCLEAWFPARGLRNLAAAWALAHGRQPETLTAASSPRQARRLVRTWAGRLNCSMIALVRATDRLLNGPDAGVPDPEQSEEQSEDDAQPTRKLTLLQEWLTISRLVQEFGQPEVYWLFGPRARLDAALELLRQQDDAERVALAKATKKAVARDPDSPEVLAFLAWRKASEAFLGRFQ